MKALSGGAWKDCEPKGVMQGGVWKTPQKVSVLQGGVWKPVWPTETAPPPPTDPVVYVASMVALNTAVTIPTHQVGDLLVIVSQSISSTPPGTPAGWTIHHGSTTTNRPVRINWKIATATNTTSGTWNGATALSAYVFRGVDPDRPLGYEVGTAHTADTMPITLEDPSGRSAVVYYWYQSGGSSWSAVPPELTTRNSLTAVTNADLTDTAVAVAPSLVRSSTGATGYRNLTFEVRATPAAP